MILHIVYTMEMMIQHAKIKMVNHVSTLLRNPVLYKYNVEQIVLKIDLHILHMYAYANWKIQIVSEFFDMKFIFCKKKFLKIYLKINCKISENEDGRKISFQTNLGFFISLYSSSIRSSSNFQQLRCAVYSKKYLASILLANLFPLSHFLKFENKK